MAEAGRGWGLQGEAGLERAVMCPPAVSAVGGRLGKAGRPIARGRCGNCFTCTSGVATIPPQAAMRPHLRERIMASLHSVLQREEEGRPGCH